MEAQKYFKRWKKINVVSFLGKSIYCCFFSKRVHKQLDHSHWIIRHGKDVLQGEAIQSFRKIHNKSWNTKLNWKKKEFLEIKVNKGWSFLPGWVATLLVSGVFKTVSLCKTCCVPISRKDTMSCMNRQSSQILQHFFLLSVYGFLMEGKKFRKTFSFF